MSELQPIRKSGEGFAGEEVIYLERLTASSLPSSLESLRHTIDWPTDMSNPKAHLTCFFGQHNYSSLTEGKPHSGIDIQLPLGAPITAPEYSTLAYRDKEGMNNKRSLTDVLLYSRNSGLVYYLCHLDMNNIHPLAAKRHWFDRDSDDMFARGERIGQVGLFFNQWAINQLRVRGEKGLLDPSIAIPADIEEVYGREYNHLHLEIHYYPNKYSFSYAHPDKPIDPLPLLKRLY